MLIIHQNLPLGYSGQMAQRFNWVHGFPDIKKFGEYTEYNMGGCKYSLSKNPTNRKPLKREVNKAGLTNLDSLATWHCP